MWTVLVLAWRPSVAGAHQSSMSYASLELHDSGKVARYEIRISTKDLYEALQLGEDRDATDAEIRSGASLLSAYVFERVVLSPVNVGCTFFTTGVTILEDGQRFARIAGESRCDEVIRGVRVHYELFFDLDPRHEGLLRVGKSLYQIRRTSTDIVVKFEESGGTSSLGFLYSGWLHVLYGLDHILFLVALLLVVGLESASARRSVRDSFRQTIGIVSSFTVAHSITLAAAALGWLVVPSRIVESIIALSILYVVLENVLVAVPRWRYRLTFAFGLIHGMGFASMLRPILPPEDSTLPLLFFNLGVELGQLCVVLCVLPVLLVVLHRLGVFWYRRAVVTTLSFVLGVLAIVWLVERAAEITILDL